MRHFLFEFITGGGLSGQPLSETLVREGEIMLQTLLNELTELDGSKISLSRDSRLNFFDNEIEQYAIQGSIEEKLSEYLAYTDVLWLIAPEKNDCLTRYAELFIKQGKIFVGSSPESIKTAASKYVTIKKLAEAGINIVETKLLTEGIPESEMGWVIKPDDGAGGEGVYILNNKNSLFALKEKEGVENLVVQPYLQGEHLSMSLLVFEGKVQLLACNKQYVDIKNDSIKLVAIGVNECLSFKSDMLKLAEKIISTITGFAGYIGVDLIEVANELYVLEINPRFTTAYAGISESLNCNVAEKILNTFLNGKIKDIELASAKPVRINV